MNKVLYIGGLSLLIVSASSYASLEKPLLTTTASTKDVVSFNALQAMRSDLSKAITAEKNPKLGDVNTSGPDFAYAFHEGNKPRAFAMTDKGLAIRVDSTKKDAGKIDALSPFGPVNMLNSSSDVETAKNLLFAHVTAEVYSQSAGSTIYTVSKYGKLDLPKPERIYSINFPSKNKDEKALLNAQRVNWDSLALQAKQPSQAKSSATSPVVKTPRIQSR